MNRTSFVTRGIFAALAAILPACDEPSTTCVEPESVCGEICVDTQLDDTNCGVCGTVCDNGTSCSAGECMSDCTATQDFCGDACVDTQVSDEHCGTCGNACDGDGVCRAGVCAAPLAVMQTSQNDGETARDLFVLEDVTLDLTKINSAAFATSRVVEHRVLPDGSLLLVAAETTEGVLELFHVSARGGALTRLNPVLAADRSLLPGIVVSRDGTKVLYRADQDADDVIDLYAVAVATPGVSVKVNGALAPGGEVSRVFAISDNGDRAAYVADQDTDELDEAFTVDLSTATPGPSVKLNEVTTTSIWDLVMTGDGDKVVYRAQDPVWNAPNLYMVEVATPGTAHWIMNPDGGEGHVDAYRLTPNGGAVVYTGSRNFLEESLWHAPLVPPYDSVELVSGAGNQWVRPDFVIDQSGGRVYFRKVDGSYDRLFRVDVATPLVTTPLTPTTKDQAGEVADFVLSGDQGAVVFRGGADGAEGGFLQPGTEDPGVDNRHAPALYHLDLAAATTPTLLSPDLSKDEGIGGGYVVTGDGVRALYRADHDTFAMSEVYLVTVSTAGTVLKVSPTLDGVDTTDVSVLSLF